MKLSEREKESMAVFAELDRKTMERKEKIERYARRGLDLEKIEAEQAERKARLEKLLDDYAVSIWKAAWLMMEEGYENTEDGIEAFCAAHPQYQKIG